MSNNRHFYSSLLLSSCRFLKSQHQKELTNPPSSTLVFIYVTSFVKESSGRFLDKYTNPNCFLFKMCLDKWFSHRSLSACKHSMRTSFPALQLSACCIQVGKCSSLSQDWSEERLIRQVVKVNTSNMLKAWRTNLGHLSLAFSLQNILQCPQKSSQYLCKYIHSEQSNWAPIKRLFYLWPSSDSTNWSFWAGWG